jgi:hypothetical protein
VAAEVAKEVCLLPDRPCQPPPYWEVAKLKEEGKKEESSFFDGIFGGSNDSEAATLLSSAPQPLPSSVPSLYHRASPASEPWLQAVKKLEEELEKTREEMLNKEGLLEQHNGDREFFEGQIADFRSDLLQKDRRLAPASWHPNSRVSNPPLKSTLWL